MAFSYFIGWRSFSLEYLIIVFACSVLFPLPTITTPRLSGLSILSRSPSTRFADAAAVAASKQPEKEISNESESAQFDILTPASQQKITDVPEGMQWKRFMWNEIDETMDQLMQGVADGTRVVKKMIDGAGQAMGYQPSASNKVKVIIKSQPRPRKLVRSKKGPKKINTFSRPKKNSNTLNDALREMEKKEEQKVEAAMQAKYPKIFGEEIITGKLSGYGDWKPVTKFVPPTTEKPYPVSELHTNVIDLPVDNSYEVTEHLTEETIQRPKSLHPKTSERLGPSPIPPTTTEKPNYPEYFLNQHKNLDIALTDSPSILREQKVLERPILNQPQYKEGVTTTKFPDISTTLFSNHKHSITYTPAPHNVQKQRDHIVTEKPKPKLRPRTKVQSRQKASTETTLTYSERRKKQGSPSSLMEQSNTDLPYISLTDHTATLLGRGAIKFGDKL